MMKQSLARSATRESTSGSTTTSTLGVQVARRKFHHQKRRRESEDKHFYYFSLYFFATRLDCYSIQPEDQKVKGEYDIHLLSAFVHGALTGLHALGVLYNVKRRNWLDVVAHSLALGYDAHAMRKHIITAKRIEGILGRRIPKYEGCTARHRHNESGGTFYPHKSSQA